MNHRALITPVFAGLVILSPGLLALEQSVKTTSVVISQDKNPAILSDQDQLKRLREHLKTLSQSLGDTHKVVESIASQRDEARREVRLGQKKLSKTQEELKNLEGKLSAALADTQKWKEKAQVVEMTQSDLQKFRNELQGAITEFEGLKGDFTKARSELSDPIERAEMKKSMGLVQKEQSNLKREIELALKAREASMAETKKVQGQWELSMRQAGELKNQLEKERNKNVGLKKRLDEALALNETNLEKLKKSNDQVTVAEANVAKLKGEQKTMIQSLESLEDRNVLTDEMVKQREELEARLAEISKKVTVAERETTSWKGRSEELAARLKERNAELAKVRKSLAQREAAMSAQPKIDPKLVAELDRVKAELARTQSEMSYLHKSKGGLEDLLFRKTAEIRDLKGKLRKVEEENQPKDGETEVDSKKDKSIGAVPIPKAIIVYEG